MTAVLISQSGCAEADNKTTSDYCVLNQADQASWSNCDGKPVKGRRPNPLEIMQHPMLDGPQLPAPDADGRFAPTRTIQSYLNVGHRQIILLSDTPFECEDNIEIMGTLEKIALGGPPVPKAVTKAGPFKSASIGVTEISHLW